MTTWQIIQMQRQADNGFVTKVLSRATKHKNGLNASEDFFVDFEKAEQFIPFDNLTEEIVLSWVKSIIDEEDVDLFLQQKINKQQNAEVLLGKPW